MAESQVLFSVANPRPTWFARRPFSISTWSWLGFLFFFILTYKWPFTNTPEREKRGKQWLKSFEIEKKNGKHTFLFHKNVTTGTLQRSIFLFLLFLHCCSLSPPTPHVGVCVPGGTERHTVPNGAPTKQCPGFQSSRLSQSLFLLLLLLRMSTCPLSLSSSTQLCVVSEWGTYSGGRWWSWVGGRGGLVGVGLGWGWGWGMLQGKVALLSTVVLTNTETCQARRLGLAQGQTLQERWVLRGGERQGGKWHQWKLEVNIAAICVCVCVYRVDLPHNGCDRLLEPVAFVTRRDG